jgi:ABC-type nitrate/sulfonate/bicarbonate transport system substrate-binding protein
VRRLRVVSVSLAAVAMLAFVAACGSDNSGSSSSATTAAATSAAATSAAATSAAATTAASASATTAAASATTAGGTAALAGTPAPKPLPTKTDVAISIVSPAEYLSAIYLAKAMGEFDKENLNVNIVRNNLSDANVLLLQGTVHMAAGGLSAGLLNAINQGSALAQVAHINDLSPNSCEGIYVRKEAAAPDGKPLPDKVKGQKVNYGGGGMAHSNAGVVTQWLQSGGLQPSDIEISTLGAGDSLIALQQGAITASYIVQPFCEQAKAGDYAVKVPNTGYSFSSYMMSADFLKNKPEVAKAILRALARTSRTYLQGDYHQNEQVVAALSSAIGIPPEQLKASAPFKFTTDLQFGQPAIDSMLNDQNVWLSAGNVLSYNQAMPVDKFVDTSLAKQVLAGQ